MSSWCSKCAFQECGPLGVHKCYCGHFRRDHVSDEPSNARKRINPPSAAQLEANRGTVLSLEDLKKNTSPESGADQGICPTCNKIFGWEAVLVVSGTRVHKACASNKICAKCKGPVGGAYVGSGGQYFHKECAGLTGTCPGCNQTLSGQMVTVAGKKYHANCLNCARCKKNVVNGFLQRGDLVYCEPCYQPFLETTLETVIVEGEADDLPMGKFEEKYTKWTAAIFGGGQPAASAGASKWAIGGGGKEKEKEKEKEEAKEKEKEKKAREAEMREKLNKEKEAKEKIVKVDKEKLEKEKAEKEKTQKDKTDKETKSPTTKPFLPSSPLSPSLRPTSTPSLPAALTPLSSPPRTSPISPLPSSTPLSPSLRAAPSPFAPSSSTPLSPSLRAPSPFALSSTPLSPSLRAAPSPSSLRAAPAAPPQHAASPPLRSDLPPVVSASPSVPARALSPTPPSRPLSTELRAPTRVAESQAGTEASEEDSHADRKVITFRFGEEVKKIRLPPLTVKLVPLHTKLLKAFPVSALALSFMQAGKKVDIANDELLLTALTTCDTIICEPAN